MNKSEFETYYRQAMSDILNQLQNVIMLSHSIETKVSEIGQSVQHLSQVVEVFLDNSPPQDP